MTIEVFIPAYNCTYTLHKTLASLVAQTDSDFSVCVVDDYSTEDIKSICDQFQMLNLRIIRNKKNLGCGLSRQMAIDTSTADYLIPLDSDDMLLPYAIAVFRGRALANPDYDFFIGYVYNETTMPDGKQAIALIKNGQTLVSGKMYKASFLKKYNIRNCEEFSRFADDTYINMLSIELGKVGYIEIPLYLYTENPNSVTNVNGGKTYWNNVIPKFLKCIQKTTEHILQYKSIHEIQHLPMTMEYIRKVVLQSNNDEYIRIYNQLACWLTENCAKNIKYIKKEDQTW